MSLIGGQYWDTPCAIHDEDCTCLDCIKGVEDVDDGYRPECTRNQRCYRDDCAHCNADEARGEADAEDEIEEARRSR